MVDDRRESLVAEEVRAPAHDIPRAVDLAAGEHVVGAQLLPHRRELRDAGEVRGVTDRRAVERPGRGPDHDVGDDAPLEQGPEHPDLADTLVPAAGQDERRARSVSAAISTATVTTFEGQPRPHTQYFGPFSRHLVGQTRDSGADHPAGTSAHNVTKSRFR